jgi:hypothetical protein
MSHYSVLVLTDEDTCVEDLLAPYSEDITVAPYVLYTKEQLIAKEKKEIKDYKNGLYAEFLKDPEGYKEKHKHNPGHLNYIEHEFRKKLYWTNARIYKEAIRFYEPESITEDGSVLSTYNPKSNWDWYVEGGRWAGHLRLKEADEYGSMTTDSAYAEEIDFSPNKEEYDSALRFWELVVEGAEPQTEDEKNVFSLYNKNYYLERYSSKEEYATRCAAFTTWAVLTPDGIWHEPGQMGWFGCHSASSEEERDFFESYHKFIEKAIENNWLVTVVDCHI